MRLTERSLPLEIEFQHVVQPRRALTLVKKAYELGAPYRVSMDPTNNNITVRTLLSEQSSADAYINAPTVAPVVRNVLAETIPYVLTVHQNKAPYIVLAAEDLGLQYYVDPSVLESSENAIAVSVYLEDETQSTELWEHITTLEFGQQRNKRANIVRQ